jgi:hypothetical protein
MDSKKATSRSGNYQDNIVIPLACEHDDDATAEEEANEDVGDLGAQAASMLSGIEKVGNL